MFFPFSRPAYVLVAHGSRDPRPGQALASLADGMAEELQRRSPDSSPMVRGAELECQPTSLADQILEIHRSAQAQNRDGLVIIPLFLSAGVHAMEDIPEAIAEAQCKLATLAETSDRPALPMVTAPVLGKHPAWATWIQTHWASQLDPSRTPVLMGHGTRRVGGNQGLEALGRSLGARLAFWSIAPKLPETLDALETQGQTELTLLPHFLFEGGITDAIARQIQAFSDQISSDQISVVQRQPFGHSPAFADFLAQAYGGAPQPPTETDPDRRPELSLV